jgi:hypothetical protein
MTTGNLFIDILMEQQHITTFGHTHTNKSDSTFIHILPYNFSFQDGTTPFPP